MKPTIARLLSALMLTLAAAAAASAQGSFFTSLSGAVVDAQGGVIPGADVKVKNTGTGIENNTVTGSDGTFTIPSLPGGTYSVTVTLQGFKTVTLNSVTLNAAVPANVKVTLQVGALEENVTVTGDSALVVQTQSPSIATNLTGAQITGLPLTSRNALDSLTSLPGFNTSGTARNSTVNGLPKSAVNITLDGMSIQDNYNKTTDGYYARLTPTLDSVEEVTVTTAGNTADSTGQGGVQIRFVTKSGSNSWTGTAYQYFRHDALNANTWFNNRDLPPDPATGKAPKTELQTLPAGDRPGRADHQEQGVLLFQLRRRAAAQPDDAAACGAHPRRGVPASSATTPAAPCGRSTCCSLRPRTGSWRRWIPRSRRRSATFAPPPATTGSLAALSNPLVQQVHVPDRHQQLQPGADGPHRLRRRRRIIG